MYVSLYQSKTIKQSNAIQQKFEQIKNFQSAKKKSSKSHYKNRKEELKLFYVGMIDLLELPTSYEVKKIYLNKGTNISTILQEKPTFPISINIISFDDKSYSLNFDSIEEISEGMNSACQSISNGKAFIIKDTNGEQTCFHRSIDNMEYIYHNGIYRLIKEQNEIQNLYSRVTSNVDESFLRKYEEPFKMMVHVEVQVAFKQMSQGEFFYKCSPSKQSVNFIFMRVDEKAKEIQYYSRKEILKRISFSSIISLKFGVNSDVFISKFKNRFTDTSLTIYYKNESSLFSSFMGEQELHLTFRTERQFDMWGTGFKAILNLNTYTEMSKKNLLWHCRLFKRFLNSQEFQLIDTFFNNSEIYNIHLKESLTYETTQLDRRINFCFEEQRDLFLELYQVFCGLSKKNTIPEELQNALPVTVENVYNATKMMINQISKMKNMIHELQQNKSEKAKEVDLLGLKESCEIDDKENVNTSNQQISSRTKKINYFYFEVFRFQFRLQQSISFMQQITNKLKK